MNYIELSKEVSYALRHNPQEYGLVLDDNGWVCIVDLLIALRKKKKWSKVNDADLVKMSEVSNKIKKEKIEPPEYLYHGTARRFLESIKKNGLTPMQRQYVHLSEDEETAYEVGKRRDDKHVMLKVKARLAWAEGISFYMGNENIWLSDTIPSQYIIFS